MFELLELGLATWRVSNMLVDERGPWDVFVKLRNAVGIKHYSDGTVAHAPPTNVLSCVWCASVWVSVGLLCTPKPVRTALAASALAIIMKEKVLNGDS